MNLSPYRPVPAWQRWLRSSAVGIALFIHVIGAVVFASNPDAAKKASEWVEMTVNQPKPPPPPPPEPEPEKPKPEPPKPKPQAVKFEETKPVEPPPVAPPPEPQKPQPRRLSQGLTANSFATGGQTGLSVRAGNTTGVKATKDGMSLDEAGGPFAPRPYTSVTTSPRLRWAPMMEVPEEAQKAGIEGEIDVILDIDEKGKVVSVKVVKGLGFGTEDACIASWKKSQWKPAMQDTTAVPVTGVPNKCTVTAVQ